MEQAFLFVRDGLVVEWSGCSLFAQRGSSEEIEVAGAGGLDVFETAVVNHDCVEVPEIDGRKIAGEDLLDFVIVFAALLLVAGLPGIVEQEIECRIQVTSAIGAMRRQAMGVVGVAEDVRVLIAALPAQGVHLEGSASDVGIEAGELKAADVESYAYLSQF